MPIAIVGIFLWRKSLFLQLKIATFVGRKNSRIDWIGKLINFNRKPRQVSFLNGGPRPSG